MARMNNWMSELKRRNVPKVAAVYVVVAWVIMQAADVMFPALHLPEWTITLVAALLIIGFPLALVLSWAFELTPDGIKPERSSDDSESRPRPIAAPLAGAVVAGLIGSGAWYFLSGDHDASLHTSQSGAPIERSIAVLPFVSLSTEEADQLFADGMSEELLNVLTRVGDLKVASRTSSFAYRGKELNITEIGRALHVAHVLEGSVRRSGNRMRITAQLIKVDDNYHVWSENYDRLSDDLIDIQDDIARRVVSALQSTLVGKDYAPLMDVGTKSGEAYRLYLEGTELLQRRGLDVARAIERFEEATSLDPDYAKAYAGLASAHLVSANYLRTPSALARSRAENSARRAIALDPQLAAPVAVLASSQVEQNNWTEAARLFEKAEQLDPNDTTTLQWHGEMLMYAGYEQQALRKLEKALEVDPESAILHLVAGNVHHVLGNNEAAKKEYGLAVQFGMEHAVLNTGLIELTEGAVESAASRFAENMHAMQFLAEEDLDRMREFLIDVINRSRSVDEAIEEFPVFASDDDFRAVMYLYGGETENALKAIEADLDNDKDTFYKVWTNVDPELRKHPYFKVFVANTGLLQYWQENGWPDRCTPFDSGDFECR